MKRRVYAASALFAALVLPMTVGAQTPPPPQGDAAAGREIALRSCATCHAVTGGPAVTTDAAPTFVSIARNPKRDRSNVAAWLMEPHMPMPNFQLTVREIADLAAYIDSLRGNP